MVKVLNVYTMAWHNGKWWPLYNSQWYSPGVSQHMFDPYSFTHLLHGVVLFFLWQSIGAGIGMAVTGNEFQELWENVWVSTAGFVMMFIFEMTWELAENSQCAIERYRQTSGTSANYEGDSVQNIIGDLIACQIGFAVSWIFNHFGVPWVSIILFFVVEISLLVYMLSLIHI